MIIWMVGILVGLDNLAVASGLGMLGVQRGRRLWFAVSCGCFEALAPALGLLIALGLRARVGPVVEWIGPACLAACGLLVLNSVVRQRENPRLLDRPLAVIVVPLALSLDNLTAGAGLGSTGTQLFPQAVVVGIISGAMSSVGFAIGARFRARSAAPARAFAGVWLLACALFSLVLDLA
jgi:putative Mn2+ efflux pump MntP